MLSYCCCRKNAEIKNQKVARTKNGRITLLSNCVICNSKKSKFLSELLGSLRIKTPLTKIPLVCPLLF